MNEFYGSVWVDLEGTGILAEEIPIIRHRNTGGVLLFSKNFKSVQQLQDLVQAIRHHSTKPILIGVDHEGGRIWRFNEGFTCPAPAADFGANYLIDPDTTIKQLHSAGAMVAQQLLACGIDLTFAPVLDLNHGVSSVIGDRSYNRDPNIVVACARGFIDGLKSQGMGAVGKHFPGHGGCEMDSHFTVAHDDRDLAELYANDIEPFAQLHSVLTGIMPAHVIYPKVDSLPAGFSKIWLQDILRNKIGFAGAIISDCLSMQGSGFTSQMIQGAEIALHAGCDMVIATQQTREHLLHVLDGINWHVTKEQHHRISQLAGDLTKHISREINQPTYIE